MGRQKKIDRDNVFDFLICYFEERGKEEDESEDENTNNEDNEDQRVVVKYTAARQIFGGFWTKILRRNSTSFILDR